MGYYGFRIEDFALISQGIAIEELGGGYNGKALGVVELFRSPLVGSDKTPLLVETSRCKIEYFLTARP